MTSNIDLHIDRLILNGFSKKDSHYISQSMQMELNRLITIHGLPKSFHQQSHQRMIRTNPMQLNRKASPENLGCQIASNIYNGLTNSKTK